MRSVHASRSPSAVTRSAANSELPSSNSINLEGRAVEVVLTVDETGEKIIILGYKGDFYGELDAFIGKEGNWRPHGRVKYYPESRQNAEQIVGTYEFVGRNDGTSITVHDDTIRRAPFPPSTGSNAPKVSYGFSNSQGRFKVSHSSELETSIHDLVAAPPICGRAFSAEGT